MAIHDPCSTRGVSEVEGSARALLGELGVTAVELNEPGLTTCCGYGGLMLFANPELAAKTVTRRGNESDEDFVTYCAMCRDRFAHHGKRVNSYSRSGFCDGNSDPAARPDPGFSRRQENRARLKNRLLREVWGEQGSNMELSFTLHISEEVEKLLEERMILVEDVRRTIAYAEQTGDKIENPATGRLVASIRPVSVTYWVEYSPVEDGFAVHNAYSHRMEVR